MSDQDVGIAEWEEEWEQDRGDHQDTPPPISTTSAGGGPESSGSDIQSYSDEDSGTRRNNGEPSSKPRAASEPPDVDTSVDISCSICVASSDEESGMVRKLRKFGRSRAGATGAKGVSRGAREVRGQAGTLPGGVSGTTKVSVGSFLASTPIKNSCSKVVPNIKFFCRYFNFRSIPH